MKIEGLFIIYIVKITKKIFHNQPLFTFKYNKRVVFFQLHNTILSRETPQTLNLVGFEVSFYIDNKLWVSCQFKTSHRSNLDVKYNYSIHPKKFEIWSVCEVKRGGVSKRIVLF